MKTKSFTKKTYEVYDNIHFVLYFNEKESKIPAEQEEEAAQTQYEYDTCLAEGIKDDNGQLQPDYGLFVSALIRFSYSQDQVEAITQNYLATPKDADVKKDFEDLQAWRAESKQIAKDYGL